MDLTKVLIILIAILIIITLYVIIKMNRFMRTIMNEEREEIDIPENKVENSEEISTIQLENNMQNIKVLEDTYPDINIEEAKEFAEKTLLSIFSTIEDYNFGNMAYYSQLIYLKIKNIISKQKELQQIEFFQDVQIESTLLKNVEQIKGYTSLVFDINVLMKHHIQNSTEILLGNPNEVISDKYSISIVYITDVSSMDYETKRTTIHGVNCPKCGESIRELKDLKCMVCDNDNTNMIENRFVAIDYSRG